MEVSIRRARTDDVRRIRQLIDCYTSCGALLDKPTVTLYEDLQEFWVASGGTGSAGDDSGPAGGGHPPSERGSGGANPARAAGTGEAGASVVGCGALHVMWEDLAEIRTVAVDPACRGQGIGHRLVTQLLATARELGVRRVFVLTFEVDFFADHGFEPIGGTPISADVYHELLRSYDEGVTEFLDLERVKPNTLGNTRMLRYL